MQISTLVIHNDHHLIALSKPAGMPTQDDRSGDNSLHRIAQAYCKRDLYPVHRLDRPCSGLVIMAKTKDSAALLSAQWQERSITKQYLAIIPKGITPPSGTLTHDLVKVGSKSVIATPAQKDEAHHATLDYRVVQQLENYDVVEINMHSGFFHQIRAQLSAAGFPIRGDVKYGARRANRDRSIGLHASALTCMHPGSGEHVTFRSPVLEHDIWPQVQSQ